MNTWSKADKVTRAVCIALIMLVAVLTLGNHMIHKNDCPGGTYRSPDYPACVNVYGDDLLHP